MLSAVTLIVVGKLTSSSWILLRSSWNKPGRALLHLPLPPPMLSAALSPLGAPRGTYTQNAAQAVPARYSASSSVAKSKGKFSQGENPVAPGRKDDVAPLTNSPGVFEIENDWTGGKPITLPGEGEPWGVDELATAALFGLPQMGWNRIQGGDAEEKRQRLFEQMDKIDAEKKKERDKRRKENSGRNVFVSPNSPKYRKGAY